MVKPAVPTIEGHYAVLRNGQIIGPMEKKSDNKFAPSGSLRYWHKDGTAVDSDFDIVATFESAGITCSTDIQSKVSSEVQQLRAALIEIMCKSDELYTASMSDGCDGPVLLDFVKDVANLACITLTRSKEAK